MGDANAEERGSSSSGYLFSLELRSDTEESSEEEEEVWEMQGSAVFVSDHVVEYGQVQCEVAYSDDEFRSGRDAETGGANGAYEMAMRDRQRRYHAEHGNGTQRFGKPRR